MSVRRLVKVHPGRHNPQFNDIEHDTQHKVLECDTPYMALSIADTRHNNSLLYAECCYSKWHVLFIVKLVIYAKCH
jgi:hypothetical protein